MLLVNAKVYEEKEFILKIIIDPTMTGADIWFGRNVQTINAPISECVGRLLTSMARHNIRPKGYRKYRQMLGEEIYNSLDEAEIVIDLHGEGRYWGHYLDDIGIVYTAATNTKII